mmetsp:Transcript_18850/g.37003  ORF Transcript_18850/g.37003 Transcript_18850/m.37003 type:complete len:1169 (-) Transcript_18850:196-3702(-)|eukprot:CAMPEP_0172674320 /NCGR_PEP_ID=MMETSP1074-20121228/12670_1 /TAXON_ID=2916 /ORGANISM="Ceratium fusus, Strain PA161109" /LENGTH=1168 /DNA_ID=CAMNT_0013491719 /DNA_START=78 /DNA_END=3584 /DNA_ORIENTATION=+
MSVTASPRSPSSPWQVSLKPTAGVPALPSPGIPQAVASLPPSAQAGLMCEAAASGDVETIRALAKAGLQVNLTTPYDLRSPLHLASASGNLEAVKALCEELGATMQQDRFGLLPIHDATQNGHTDIRRFLQRQRLNAADNSALTRSRACSMEHVSLRQQKNEWESQIPESLLATVFELVLKEGVFSYTTVHAEVNYFFTTLSLHPVYFSHFTPLQIARHVHCLTAAKRVAHATGDVGRMDFSFKTEETNFFLTTIDCPEPTDAQKRTEEQIVAYLSEGRKPGFSTSLLFMASDGPAMMGGKERLGIFHMDECRFDAKHVSDGETSIEVLASSKFLKEKTVQAKEQYQIIVEDVMARKRAQVRVVPGSVYPGPYPGGFVVLVASYEVGGSLFFPELQQALRHNRLIPRRCYMENFANGVTAYSIFFPNAKEQEVRQLERTIMHSTLLKAYPGRSGTVYDSVMDNRISHEVGLYVLAAVKFAYYFFPKEQYAPEYLSLHQVLDRDERSQHKLERLYALCLKELLQPERIYTLVQQHLDLMTPFFEDFRAIAVGDKTPKSNEELEALIDNRCPAAQDQQILRMFLIFNESLRLTNFFQAETPGAMAFRLDPTVVLRGRPSSIYPVTPYAIYMIAGRDFTGFHVRFKDVARGGIRMVLSRDKAAYEKNSSMLFDECYNLALTQQYKNKDIPEGGSKGVILPDSKWPGAFQSNLLTGTTSQSPASQRAIFTRYISALLDCMLPDKCGIYSGHLPTQEILFFGPDENTAGFMDLGAQLGKERGYQYWKALTTGKSTLFGGVPHDTYGMTTASVHTYVLQLLDKLGIEEESITKFQTGGPDGDLGSNEILVSKDKTVAIVDGSGVLYDPAGINREELVRLAKLRVPVKNFSRSFLGSGGFLVTVEETNVTLPDGSTYRTGAEVRDSFHLGNYATADLFVPCGGRPNSVVGDTVKKLFVEGHPKFKMVVEGANLFFSDAARRALEEGGVHLFKDASTNKGGVTSSSLEVFASLALSSSDHGALMTYNPDSQGDPPEFYQTYVEQVLDNVKENARQEFSAIWACNQKDGTKKTDLTRLLSLKINQMCDTIEDNLTTSMTEEERGRLVRFVLRRAVPPLIIERLGVDGVLDQVPKNYIFAIVGSWIASRFVYRHGIHASEVSFFFFMRSLLAEEDAAK